MRNHERYDHAIVIGGSIAGLLAARVLADFFSQVTLIERDALPTGAQARKGAPQARHAHNIMLRGREIIEAYCPGITQELCHQGATLVDTSADMLWLTRVGWIPRFASGIETLACGRDLLESQIRHRVTAHPQIQIAQKTDVLGLLLNGVGERVSGGKLRQRGPDTDGVTETMHADLVIDASGRNSRAPQWLAALGYPTPPELTVDAQLWYASMIYAIPPSPQGAKSIFIQANAPETARMGILLPIEGNRWLVSVKGTATDERPTDTASFLAFLKTLRSPLLYERLKDATSLSPVAGNGSTANRLRQYERIRMPEQFMVLGDALCAFNPVYGQGVTVAALESQALANCLTTQRRLREISYEQKTILGTIHSTTAKGAIGCTWLCNAERVITDLQFRWGNGFTSPGGVEEVVALLKVGRCQGNFHQ